MHGVFDSLTGLVFIILIFGGGYIRHFFRLQERRLEIEASQRQSSVASAGQEIAELKQQISQMRAELAQLRDTSTQYDMSIQSSLEETQHRLAFLESRSRAQPSEAQVQPVQPLGYKQP